MRNYHREDYAEEQELVALELESCETVCDEAADERLDKSAGERKDKGIKESGKVVVVLYYSSIGVERRVLRDKSYRYVNEVFTTHEGGGNLREEREEDYVGNTQEEKESEQIPNYLLQSIEIDELSFTLSQKGVRSKSTLILFFVSFVTLGAVCALFINHILLS